MKFNFNGRILRNSPAILPNNTGLSHLAADWQSEFDVCTSCGSLTQCSHDFEDENEVTNDKGLQGASERQIGMDTLRSRRHISHIEPRLVPASGVGTDAENNSMSAGTNMDTDAPTVPDHEMDTCDMVSNVPISPWTEVFNTYGEHLTNAQLLTRYGFALDENANDVVTFRLDDLPSLADMTGTQLVSDRASLGPLYRQVLQEISRYRRWDPSNLVYHPDDLLASPGSAISASTNNGRSSCLYGGGQVHGAREEPLRLCVNSDAKVSHALWVYCAVLAVLVAQEGHHRSVEFLDARVVAAGVEHLAAYQLLLELNPERAMDAALEADADDDEGDGDLPRDEGTQNSDKVS